jgi:hypothetical protein
VGGAGAARRRPRGARGGGARARSGQPGSDLALGDARADVPRFDTLFFAARVEPDVLVRVDGGEISGHRWFAPDAAVAAMREGQIRLAPPTFVTVSWLAAHASAAAALAALARTPLVTFHPRICPVEGGACILYPGDAGYEAGDPARPGPRHRLLTSGGDGFQYERSGC